MKTITNLNQWLYSNLDLIEEDLEKNDKSTVLVCGASSSGKSYSTELLKEFLEKHNHKCCILSTDSYNKGISGIITDKVNSKYFKNSLNNIEKIQEIVKKVIISTDFNDKFNKDNIKNLHKYLKEYMNENEINKFCSMCKYEFDNINFDESSVYDLKLLANDINALSVNQSITKKEYSKIISEQILNNSIVNGGNYDVILVEGIYALNENLSKNLTKKSFIKNFIDCDSKTMFLRRIIRDCKNTSASTDFTIKAYVNMIYPSYINEILPTKNSADFILQNNMTFDELRNGEKFTTKIKIKITDANFLKNFLSLAETKNITYIRDTYFSTSKDDNENILRVRETGLDNINFNLLSLVHKGIPKARKDNKVIRPVNILVKDGKLSSLYPTYNNLVENFRKIQLQQSKIESKTRVIIFIKGEKYVLDKYKNGEIYLQCDEKNIKVLNNLKNKTSAMSQCLDCEER